MDSGWRKCRLDPNVLHFICKQVFCDTPLGRQQSFREGVYDISASKEEERKWQSLANPVDGQNSGYATMWKAISLSCPGSLVLSFLQQGRWWRRSFSPLP